jgi:outer membrane receptor protein involved in Fe transport
MLQHFFKPVVLSTGVFIVASTLSERAAAEDQSNNRDTTVILEEISVVGEKVNRDLKHTASSVRVLTPDEIAKQRPGAATVLEALRDIPNVILTDTVSAPIIRGQDSQGPNSGANAFVSGTVPRATINVDGHYLSFNEFVFGATSIWDIKSIEVFRGPQTTAQGANAIAGAIIVNTKDPTFTPETAFQTELGGYAGQRAAFALSGPLIENQLAARIAVDYAGRNTFIDYASPRFQRGDTDQDFRSLNVRAKLLWRPTEIRGMETKLTYSHSGSNRPSEEAANRPFDRLQSFAVSMPTWNQVSDTLIHDITYDLANGFVLYNQTQFTDLDTHRVSVPATNGNATIALENVSNELRTVYGSPQDVLSGMGGIYYANTKIKEALYLNGTSRFDDTKDNLGLFTEASYRLTDLWTLTSGLRYERDTVKRLGVTTLSRQRLDYDRTFSALLPRISLAYALTPDWTVGALVSRGYNPGGVSLDFTSGRWRPFDAETLWNYELFTRASLLDNRLTLNSNLFYTDFTDTQRLVNVILGPGLTQSYVINAQKAHAYGLETAIDYQILEALRLRLSAGALQTEIDKLSYNVSFEGKDFAKSPGYMLSVGASWDVTAVLNLTATVRHIDGYFSDDANTRLYAVKPYTLADARIAYRVNDGLELYAYAQNVLDERAPTYIQANRGIGLIEASMTVPRTFGVGMRGSF